MESLTGLKQSLEKNPFISYDKYFYISLHNPCIASMDQLHSILFFSDHLAQEFNCLIQILSCSKSKNLSSLMIIYAYQIISCLLIFVRRLFYALHLKLTCIIER